jgi:hypothetical protein
MEKASKFWMGLQKQLRFQVLDETTEILLIIKSRVVVNYKKH